MNAHYADLMEYLMSPLTTSEMAEIHAAALIEHCARAKAEAQAALLYRDSLDVGSADWHMAHVAGAAACHRAAVAEQALYDARLAHAPYWHVRPGSFGSAR